MNPEDTAYLARDLESAGSRDAGPHSQEGEQRPRVAASVQVQSHGDLGVSELTQRSDSGRLSLLGLPGLGEV